MHLLANLELFEKGIEVSESVTKSWDRIWQDTLGRGGISGELLYGILCDLGVIFAVGTLIIFSIQLFKDLNESNYAGLSALIWPFVVAMLLANDGAILSSITLDIRNTINQVNQRVLTVAFTGAKLDEIFRQAQGIGNSQGVISGYIRQCEALIGEKQVQCLEQALDQAEALMESYRGAYGPAQWIQERIDDIQAIRDAVQKNPLSILNPAQNPIYWGLIGPAWEAITYGLLWAWQMAFQTGVEVTLLLTALIGPLAIGGSLLPVGAKPIFAWLTGLFSIGLLKLSFNIVAGLAAAMFVQASRTDPLFFPMFLGIFAPLLAGAIAFGGGLAIWSSITGAARSTIGVVTKLF